MANSHRKLNQRVPRLLVVDDEDDLRKLIQELLTKEGLEIDGASSGDDAVMAARSHSYDLVLLDLNMPGMDGKETLATLKSESPHTDFMVVTGYSDIATAVELLKLGAKEYITKPIKPREFVQRVKSIVRSHSADTHGKQLQAEFSSRLHNDLQSPVAAISSAVDFLKKNMAGPTTDRQQQMLDSIKTNISKMDALLNDMIDLTLFESGSVALDKFPMNLDELIPAICDRMKPLAAAKNISLSVHIDSTVPTVEVDAGKMDQVITNLLDNGIKYTDNGGSIRIAAIAVTRPLNNIKRECVEISVTDTGSGISKAELPFVFDKYKDVLTGKTSSKKTTGLGLALCRSIVEAHHGAISAESDLGKGSTFRILLPADAA